ncbi:MAG: PIG-L family deacetylase [Candidatus Omnitrophica bacterium]|nr:PIG-L family deacetylase [Candidatus Omnitrophota bacterium]MDD5236052.1 PIG-L family deacetylase [Candidatus Omnitrophota bacterium]MDD5609926.1 PIG-L family deacetylase [Candidatus Omnitrophota bacterium]
MKIKTLFFFLYLAAFFLCTSSAQGITDILPFEKTDRVLFMAPHPDDEAIGTGGLIQQAVSQGLPVKVVYFTNGDNNQLAFIVYEKRILFRKGAFVFMGEVRRKEAIKAMGLAGIDKKSLIFLGYPDFGTMHIFTKYWMDKVPFRSMLTRVTEVPYKECFSYRASYTGESILIDLKTILEDFMPTKIFVSHPVDANVDHRAFYLFLRVALWDLEKNIKAPIIYPYPVHSVGWPKPRGFHPDLDLRPPETLAGADIRWFKFDLDKKKIEKKRSMISCYRSQIQYNPPYLFSFDRKNELVGDFPDITVTEQIGQVNWQGIKEELGSSQVSDTDSEESFEGVSYAQKNGILYIRMELKKILSVNMGINVFLFGYNKHVPFAAMPKIRIRIGFRGNTIVYDKRRQISIPGLQVKQGEKELFVQVPLARINNPDYILSAVLASNKGLPSYETAWRILKLK